MGISSQFYQLTWENNSLILIFIFADGSGDKNDKKNDRKRGIEFSFEKSTFGTKTKHKVAVLQNIINIANIINMASCLSANTKLIAAPVTHMITTLYTLIPTYLLSFNAGMLTCLVSHAKKAPNIWNMKKVNA